LSELIKAARLRQNLAKEWIKNPTENRVPRFVVTRAVVTKVVATRVVARWAMQRFIPRCVLALAGLMALAGCSTDIGNINIIPKPELRPDWLSYSGHKEEFTLREAGAADLVGPDGQCAGGRQEQAVDPATGTPAAGISLQMTECDVVNRIGAPDRVDLGSTERGERAAVLTYTRGARPGIYRFSSGRLVSIERGAEAPPERPKKAAPQKKKT
jgi:hypothetical protein